MINKKKIEEIISQSEFTRQGFYLVDMKVDPQNNIRIFMDHKNGITIGNCAAISRYVESQLNKDIEDFDLQVSSPGLDIPLQSIWQYEKNTGNTIAIICKNGMKKTGKLVSASAGGIEIETKEPSGNPKKKAKAVKKEQVDFKDIKTAKVMVDFKK